jgi:hypothetical protein
VQAVDRQPRDERVAGTERTLSRDVKRDERVVGGARINEARRAELLDALDDHGYLDLVAAAGIEPDVLGPNAECNARIGRHVVGNANRWREVCRRRIERHPSGAVRSRVNPRIEKVHLRRADEARDEPIRRMVVEGKRCADLLDAAGAEHDDAVGHRHRLDLVVRHVDHRRREPPMQRADLVAHRDAKLGIEVRQRLVEEEDRRLANDRATDRDALPLAARELRRPPLEQRVEAQHLRRRLHARFDLRRRRAQIFQAEREVLPHRHVRVERIRLEDHRQSALRGRHVVDAPLADVEFAAGDALEPADHSQERRLAATGGPDEHDELAVADIEIGAVNDGRIAEALDDVVQSQRCHVRSLRYLTPLAAMPVVMCRWRSANTAVTGRSVITVIASR